MRNLTKWQVRAAGLGSALATGAAMAQDAGAPDTSAIVTTIGYAGTAGAAIGVAVLSMHYGIKLYKWIKAAG